jgi:hypothetical protein
VLLQKSQRLFGYLIQIRLNQDCIFYQNER